MCPLSVTLKITFNNRVNHVNEDARRQIGASGFATSDWFVDASGYRALHLKNLPLDARGGPIAIVKKRRRLCCQKWDFESKRGVCSGSPKNR